MPVDRIAGRLETYRTHSMGWTVKHFHEHLQARDDVPSSDTPGPRRPDAGRPRKPWIGMMLHQDGSRHAWLSGQAACDLPPARALRLSRLPKKGLRLPSGVFTRRGLPGASCTDRGSHSFHTPEAGGLAPRRAASPSRRQGEGSGPRMSRWHPRRLPRPTRPRPLPEQRRADRNTHQQGRVNRCDATEPTPGDNWTATATEADKSCAINTGHI